MAVTIVIVFMAFFVTGIFYRLPLAADFIIDVLTGSTHAEVMFTCLGLRSCCSCCALFTEVILCQCLEY